LRDRLAARLKLSERYMRKWKRIKARVGLTAVYEKMDELTNRKGDLEEDISRAEPITRSDRNKKRK
jgi:hypothetical protein